MNRGPSSRPPDVTTLRAMSALLEVLNEVVIAAHIDGPKGARQDQARSILMVGRILADQVNAYLGLVEMENQERRPRRAQGR